jgi:putative transposase
MPEHFHLLLSAPHEGNLSSVMQALKLGFARRVLAAQRRGGRVEQHCGPTEAGRIWQARFYDFNVWSERKRTEKLRYMHRETR